MPRARVRRLLLAAVLLLGGCAGVGRSRGPLILPPSADDVARARLVAERARAVDVVYLGEVHDNPSHHVAQARILEAILAAGARPALAFEMLPEAQQAALDDTLARAETAAEGDRRLRWTARGWPDFAMYWPLFALARQHRLSAVATDLDPVLVRRIARDGLAGLGDAGGWLASRLSPDPAREAGIAKTIQTAHCDALPVERLPRMVESWHARNVTIARHLVEALGQGRPVIVIVGRGHQGAGGVPAQLEVLRPETRQLVVEMLEVAPGERVEEAVRDATGDVLWLEPAVERPDPCADLRQRLRGAGRPRGVAAGLALGYDPVIRAERH